MGDIAHNGLASLVDDDALDPDDLRSLPALALDAVDQLGHRAHEVRRVFS
jgi:hypothetical protein